jgi:integrase
MRHLKCVLAVLTAALFSPELLAAARDDAPKPAAPNTRTGWKAAEGDERTAFAMMAYAGLRVGEAVQLQWDDLHSKDDRYTMIHVRRGGSRGTTKDKDERFVPVHPKVALLLGTPKKRSGRVLSGVSERALLRRVK